MEITFRKLKERDWPEIARLSEEFREYNLKLIRDFDRSHAFFEHPFTKKDFFKILRRKDKLYIAAIHRDRIVGFAYAQTAAASKVDKSKTVGWLSEIFITKAYRRKGVGDKIWDEILAWFKLKKVSFLQLNVFCNNERAVEVYKKWGFKPYTMIMSRKL